MIDEAKLRQAFAALVARVEYLERALALFVPDRELDAKNGNPVVRFPSKKWIGPNFEGKRFSECTPDFLEAHAKYLTWKADNPQAGREKYSAGQRLDAARARSWARRLRAGGWTPPPPPERPAGRPGARRSGAGGRPAATRPGRPGRPAAPADEPAATSAPAPPSAPEEPRPNSPADVGYTAPEQPAGDDLEDLVDDDEDLFGPEDDAGDGGRPNEPGHDDLDL